MRVTNPYTEETRDIEEAADIETLFEQAATAAPRWRSTSVTERVAILRSSFDEFSRRSDEAASIITQEVGKPINLSRVEITRTTDEWSYMLDHAQEFLASETIDNAQVVYAPLGVVAVISPWNFPILLPLRGIVPALLAGNAVVYKPSELSPMSGLFISKLISDQAPLFIAVGGKESGAAVVKTPVAAVAFTGSTVAGKAIAKEASQTMKRLSLELGGLDAAIVLPDADVEMAATQIVTNNATNSGQVCNAVKRALVHDSIYDAFVEKAKQVSASLIYGDPMNSATQVGPLVSQSQRERVRSFLEDAVQKGASCHQITSTPDRGFFFGQAILTNVPDTARLLQEEPFGPILPVLRYHTEAEAIRIANNTRYGLTASIWTRNTEHARILATSLEVGLVRINSHQSLGAGVPWGGCKESGIGRMKTKEGLREFTNVQVIA